ncbi:MAG: FAD-dependent oxidoreductase [Thiohalophilus sp.]|jgi:glycerol-3-phosphate dehydrogenase
MSEQPQSLSVDIVIIGGGIAGLWLLSRLRREGYQAILLESHALGAGQTRYAQGIIHGGTKYALTGKLTASSEAVSRMPGIWRDCLQGKGEVDLARVQLLSDHQYMWSTGSLTSRLAGFFASHVMQSRTHTVDKSGWPSVFQNKKFRGQVYRLDEPVLDTMSVIRALAEPQQAAIAHIDSDSIKLVDDTLEFRTIDSAAWKVTAKRIVLTAGKGNAALVKLAHHEQPAMQTRPLKMVIVRGGLPEALFAHCVDANVNPRITITSHRDSSNEIVWYLGGQVAEEGVDRSDKQQIAEAKQELQNLLPWVDFSHSEWANLYIERAEPQQPGGKRPDNSYVHEQDRVMTAWPTKMALAPNLAAEILDRLQRAGISPGHAQALPSWPSPPFAVLPWQEEERWKSGH